MGVSGSRDRASPPEVSVPGADAVRHIVMFRYAVDAPEGEREEFEAALRALPAQIPEIRSYRLCVLLPADPRDTASGAAAPYDVVAEALFDNAEGYAAYSLCPAHRAVCPKYRHILTARAALQWPARDAAPADGAGGAEAQRVLLLLQARDGVTPEQVEQAAEKIRAAGPAAVPGAVAVAAGADVRIPKAPGQSPNHDLCVAAVFPAGAAAPPPSAWGKVMGPVEALLKDGGGNAAHIRVAGFLPPVPPP